VGFVMAFVVRSTVPVKREKSPSPPPEIPEQPQKTLLAKPKKEPRVIRAQLVVNSYTREEQPNTGPPIVPKKKSSEASKAKKQALPSTRRKRVHVEQTTGTAPEVLTMPDYEFKEDPVALFGEHLKTAGRVAEEMIATIPEPKQQMALAEKLESKDQPIYFKDAIAEHSIENGLEIPVLEEVSPEYIATFLEGAKNPWERECKPPFDSKTKRLKTCESVAMGGPPLKEFLLPSQKGDLMSSPYFDKMSQEKTLVLPEQTRSCWLCSQALTTFLHGMYMSDNASDDDDDDDDDNNNNNRSELHDNVIIHDYRMPVNSPGMYDGNLMLPSFKKWVGIAGPVIGHNRRHYALEDGDHWVQLDKMFFQDGAMKSQ